MGVLLASYCVLITHFNSLAPEFKMPAEPINARDKMAAPMWQLVSVRITLFSTFLQSKRLQDCWYFLFFAVVWGQRKQRWTQLVLSRKMGVKLTQLWGAKLKLCLRLSPSRIVFHCWLTPTCIHQWLQLWMATFVEEDSASIVMLKGSPCRWREDRVSTSSRKVSHCYMNPIADVAVPTV